MNKTVTQHCLSDLPQIRVQVTHAIANTESSKRACTSIGFEICATVCDSLVVCHKSKAVKCSTRLPVITKQLSFLPVVELCECVCVCVCLSVCLPVVLVAKLRLLTTVFTKIFLREKFLLLMSLDYTHCPRKVCLPVVIIFVVKSTAIITCTQPILLRLF